MYPLIEIKTVPIEIEMKVSHAKLEYSRGTADLEISRGDGGLSIKSRPIRPDVGTSEVSRPATPPPPPMLSRARCCWRPKSDRI